MEKLTMKELKHFTRCLVAACGIISAGLILTGCQSEPKFAEFPNETGNTAVTNAHPNQSQSGYKPPVGTSDALIIGDVVTITFNSGDTQPLPLHKEAIKDDGRITPPYIPVGVVAKGKSPGELQAELQKLYDKLYRNMTVTVTSEARYYTVLGEVKNPGQKLYLGATTIRAAIAAASDFTDFAKKTQVHIRRANGKKETVDAIKAIEEPDQNVPVYPGDEITVPRRFF